LTRDRAKPAVPFGGIYRVIDFSLSNCINSGLRRIHVLTQYKSISLARHLRMAWDIFNGELGEYIDVIPAQQRVGDMWYRGTADSVYQNIYSIAQEKPEHVLILAGDHIYKMDYTEMLDFHISNKAELTIATVCMPKREAAQFGTVNRDKKGAVISLEEKNPKAKGISGREDCVWASMGIYLFNTSVLEKELVEDASRSGSVHDFARSIIPKMLKDKRKKRVFAYEFKDKKTRGPLYWRDIGSLDAYYNANMDLVHITPQFNLYYKKWPIRTYHEQFPPAKTVFVEDGGSERTGMALNSLISEGCIISGGKVQGCVLSPDVRINSFSQVYDSVLMEGVNVSRYAKIRRAIIDKDVNIPENMEIGYDLKKDKKRFTVTDSGIVIVAKGTIIEKNNKDISVHSKGVRKRQG